MLKMKGNEMRSLRSKSNSLKLINGGPNKVRGLGKTREINKWGDIYLAPGSRNQRAQGASTPHFSKARAKCPFSCNSVAFLEDFEDAKINRKMHVFSDFKRSEVQNFPRELAPVPT